MPKDTLPSLPLSGLFAVAKPSGPTSMAIINDIKSLINTSPLFVEQEKLDAHKEGKNEKPKRKRWKSNRDMAKIGQGGTLDPLADGVLVIGIGKGTKKLSEFLDCEYKTTCLLGCETDSYDSQGAQVRVAPWKHVTRETVENALSAFRGQIEQTPPIFSALKMDGIPLYEYARSGTPLPRKIEKRPVTIHSLEVEEWLGSDHNFRYPGLVLSKEQKRALENTLRSVQEDARVVDEPEESGGDDRAPTAFVLRMKVSGGTYVRSVVHDLGHAVGSAAHVVTLTRSRQGRFTLEPIEAGDVGCVSWDVFKAATEDVGPADEDGHTAWEREVIDRFEVIDTSGTTGSNTKPTQSSPQPAAPST
ncbi:pseudouridine synthase [Thelephora ganbajun]|uniref:Pseudouridine synthase n=1 Tax=Thelephora ganbajun TaxID=370292 RepID=A0ACB6ZEB0_THEGA|nr:pseudouridine synthase [Thelephora ganbajun]